MRFTFLGTAAANAYPEAFCSCPNCIAARLAGGKSLRKRSAALINSDLLIDLGPDIMVASQIHNIDLTKVNYCLQTHPHADHMDLSHLLSRSPDFGVLGAPKLEFLASKETLLRANTTFQRDLSGFGIMDSVAESELNCRFRAIEPFSEFRIGEYTIVPFPASHANGFGAMLYSIKSGDFAVFYGTDTGVLNEDVWRGFKDFNLRFNAVILDHTYGAIRPNNEHMGFVEVAETAKRFQAEGRLTYHGRVYATHIAHDCNPIHEDLSEKANRNGYAIGYDGLSLDFV